MMTDGASPQHSVNKPWKLRTWPAVLWRVLMTIPTSPAAPPIGVTITGCVVSPGKYELPPGTTLGELIDMVKIPQGGGLGPDDGPLARPRKTSVVRKGEGDSRISHTLDARESSPERDFELADGDYIFVPEAFF